MQYQLNHGSLLLTLQGRGPRPQQIHTLGIRLLEHLGILYRGYLELDRLTNEPYGTITIFVESQRIRVSPIPVPSVDSKTERFTLDIGGHRVDCEYVWGLLDTEIRRTLVLGNATSYYYLGNQPTQGIDIRIGKRTIETRQFDQI